MEIHPAGRGTLSLPTLTSGSVGMRAKGPNLGFGQIPLEGVAASATLWSTFT